MYFKTLTEWLDWQSLLHPQEIDLGLTRCATVAHRLQLLSPSFPIIIVAGTNGKGSSVAFLDAILTAAGYRVGRFTSPHLLRYNERVCIAGQEANDAQLCESFHLIEEARGQLSLTFFEFNTLSAMLIFQQSQVDIAILEVGLGGRLDAVNLFDAEISLVTCIGIDHVEWLGQEREAIAFEKAGIFRAYRPAVCSDPAPPHSLIEYASHLSTPLYCLGRDFTYQKSHGETWSWQSPTRCYTQLPFPNLPGDFQLDNAAGVLMVLEQFNPNLSLEAIRWGLTQVKLSGRFQVFTGPITRILDVAHNPLGVQVLKELLVHSPCSGQTHAVVGILKDKDISGMLEILRETITHWHVAPLNTPRSAKVEELVHVLKIMAITPRTYSSVPEAYHYAYSHAQSGDRVVVLGSFYTVAEVLKIIEHELDAQD